MRGIRRGGQHGEQHGHDQGVEANRHVAAPQRPRRSRPQEAGGAKERDDEAIGEKRRHIGAGDYEERL